MLKQQTYTLPHDRDNQISSVGCLVLLFSKLSARIVMLMKKGRARHPPENLQQWRLPKQQPKQSSASEFSDFSKFLENTWTKT